MVGALSPHLESRDPGSPLPAPLWPHLPLLPVKPSQLRGLQAVHLTHVRGAIPTCSFIRQFVSQPTCQALPWQ